jgi:hypothetical protein
MKNSAWYHKLWLKKLDELPVQDDAAAAAWAGMKAALDKTMPPGAPGAGHAAVKPFGAKLISLVTYVLPAAAMIGGGAYFLQHKATKQHHPKHKTEQHQPKNNTTPADSLMADSLLTDSTQLLKDTILAQPPAPQLLNRADSAKAKTQPGIGRWVQRVVATQNGAHTATAQQTPANNTSNGGSQTPVILNVTGKPEANEVGNNTSVQPGQTNNDNSNQANSLASAGSGSGNAGMGSQGKPAGHEKTNTLIDANKAKVRNSGKSPKSPKYRQLRDVNIQPYHYGVEFGFNTGGGNNNVYFGGFGAFNLNNKWLVNAGLRINTKKQLSGVYTHASFYAPDSLNAFRVTDSRKILTMDIPLNLEYKVSGMISFKAGPVISLGLSQSNNSAKVSELNRRDSLFFRKTITDTLGLTTVKKLNVGFSGGVSLHIKQFDIDGRYQLMPYKVSSPLGSYRKVYNTFQLGVSYRF